MAEVTITLSDTPDGSLALQSNFTPEVGKGISNAQAAALDIMIRTRRDWGLGGAAQPNKLKTSPAALCRDLLDPEALGHAVPAEVRARAREALGLLPGEAFKVVA